MLLCTKQRLNISQRIQERKQKVKSPLFTEKREGREEGVRRSQWVASGGSSYFGM
jgi:hypothetical protein